MLRLDANIKTNRSNDLTLAFENLIYTRAQRKIKGKATGCLSNRLFFVFSQQCEYGDTVYFCEFLHVKYRIHVVALVPNLVSGPIVELAFQSVKLCAGTLGVVNCMNQRCLYRQIEPPDEGGSVVFSDALLLLRSFNLDLLSEDTGLHVRSDAYSVDGAGLCNLQCVLIEG